MLVHTETQYFAGAQTMLGYLLDEATRAKHEVVIALAENQRMKDLVPNAIRILPLPNNQPFSLAGLWRQLKALQAFHRAEPVDVLHGWAARDWELTSSAGFLLRTPSVGTLHDHPQASFHSCKRQKLMRFSARGLKKIACVSNAVYNACKDAGYAEQKLTVIHNGLPRAKAVTKTPIQGIVRLGYLGVLSERKGLRGMFEMVAGLFRQQVFQWDLSIAGGAQDAAGEQLVTEIHDCYRNEPWWDRVRWLGWIKQPSDFLKTIDILLMPSRDFDPLPTVLLEAGRSSVPALAANVGGVPEIVGNGENGWLFPPGDWFAGSTQLAALIRNPVEIQSARERAWRKIDCNFSAESMLGNYLNLYTEVKSGI